MLTFEEYIEESNNDDPRKRLQNLADKIERVKKNQKEIYAKYTTKNMMPPNVSAMKKTLQKLVDEYNKLSTEIGLDF